MKNFDDYIKAVRLKCEEQKSGKYGSYFSVPSPAQLRNLCLVLFDNRLSKIDDVIFRLFFKVNSEEDLRKAIENFDVVKFRAVQNFFTGKNEKTNMQALNLIAVLVDYPSRPYNKFLKEEEVEKKQIDKVVAEELLVEEIPTRVIQTDGIQSKNESHQEVNTDIYEPQINQQDRTTKPRSKHKALILFLIVLSLVTGGYMAKDVCFPEKQCMQWQEDHYQRMDCEADDLGSIVPIIALDNKIVNLKRVHLKKGMVFFKYGKPLYYYCKVSRDSVEFFNAPGEHPVTGKSLDGITWYMINKYVK